MKVPIPSSRYAREMTTNEMLISDPIATPPTVTSGDEADQTETPVGESQRLLSLDVLRGVALLGILLLNIEDFAGVEGLWDIPTHLSQPAFTGWHTGLDYAIVILKWLFAEGKMRSLFSMLFGAGVVLLTERLEQRSSPGQVARIYYRRNLWLLFFGLCHGFILWFGDILVDYSIMALVFLYPLRRLGARTLIIFGLTVWLVGGTFGSTRAFDVAGILHLEAQVNVAEAADGQATTEQRELLQVAAKQRDENAVAVEEYIRDRRLGFLAGWQSRVRTELMILKLKFPTLWFLEWLGAMITGMGLYKSGYLTNKLATRVYIRLTCAGYAIAIPLVLVGLWNVQHRGFTNGAFARWMAIPYSTEVLAGTLANTSVLLLLIRSGYLRKMTSHVAVVGRTAFSNYILTTIICQFLFSWGPWKLYNTLEYYQWYIIVAAIWGINLLVSSLWLSVFAFGPLEWLWRSLTYWNRQQMLLSARFRT
jgi:uncharacterized protein